MGYGQHCYFPFLPACRKKDKYFFRGTGSPERKSAHRQWSEACRALRLRLASSVGVGRPILRSPVLVYNSRSRPKSSKHANKRVFRKRTCPGLHFQTERAAVPCPLPTPAAMPVLVESMQSAYGQRRCLPLSSGMSV